jgi:UDP-N-acetylmuramate-alanine ligase/ribosomal protein S18 acetylase RimI-like enzyme
MSRIVLVWVWGSGMSALAQILYRCGYTDLVGVDASESIVTNLLAQQGICIIIWHGVYEIEDDDFVIYSDATLDAPEVIQAKCNAQSDEKHFRYPLSYFEFVGEVSKYMKTIAIAGSHGKSTTTSMMIGVLYDHPQFGLGIVWAQMKQFDHQNFVIPEDKQSYIKEILWHILSAKKTLQNYDLIKKYRFVVEADEFNRHFLYLDIDHLLITNIQRDHPDTYPTYTQYTQVFEECLHKTHGSVVMLDDGCHQDFKKKYARRIHLCPSKSYQFEYIFGQHNHANASLVEWFCNLHLTNIFPSTTDNCIHYVDKLTMDDRQVYKFIRLEMFKEAPEAFGSPSYNIERHYPDQYRKDKMLEVDRYHLLVYDRHECIGAINAKIRNDDPHGGGIFGVYLRASYRWKGIAQHMLDRCIDFLQYQPWVKYIKLRVLAGNTHAIDFYQKYGFCIQKEVVINKHDKQEEAYIMTYRSVWMRLCQYPWIVRRCEYLGQTPSLTNIYSDYAHHPTEVSATYHAMRQAFPDRQIHVIYQPHQAGRVLNLWDQMIEACTDMWHLCIYRIYTAREHIESLLAQQNNPVFESMQNAEQLWMLLADATGAVYLDHFDQAKNYISNLWPQDIVCIMTAGDLDGQTRARLQSLSI